MPKSYIFKASVQKKQNMQFFKAIKPYLEDFPFKTLLDIGGADGEFCNYFHRVFGGIEVHNLDKDEELIEYGRQRYPHIKHIHADFLEWDTEERFDVIVSTNTFHWFGSRWSYALLKTYDLLEEGGYFFLHQVCEGSYCSLISLARMLLEVQGVEDFEYDMAFLSRANIVKMVEELGFRVVFHARLEEYAKEYSLEESYRSWLVGAGMPFVMASPDREWFEKAFMEQALKRELPVGSVRAYVFARKPLKTLQVKKEGNSTYLVEHERWGIAGRFGVSKRYVPVAGGLNYYLEDFKVFLKDAGVEEFMLREILERFGAVYVFCKDALMCELFRRHGEVLKEAEEGLWIRILKN